MKKISANSIKSKDDIELIKKSLQVNKQFCYDRHLLYFVLGINTCLRPDDLIQLRWATILNSDHTIKDFIDYNGYYFYLNHSCKSIIYNYIHDYNNFAFDHYVFGNNKPLKIQTINKFLGDTEKALGLSYNLSALSLLRTFVYWQIYYNHYDYVKMTKLHNIIYKSKHNLNFLAEYNVADDKIYINDVNL